MGPIPQEFIDRVLRQQKAKEGSPADYVGEEFKQIQDTLGTGRVQNMDMGPGEEDPEWGNVTEYGEPASWMDIMGAVARPAGVAAFMNSPRPPSLNVEDRRNQTQQDFIRELMKGYYDDLGEGTYDPTGREMIMKQGGYQTLPDLPVPTEFGFVKRGPR